MIEKNESLKKKIFEDIMNNREELDVREIIIEVLKHYAELIPFKEPDPDNMLDEAEEDLYPADTRLFSQYIGGIESGTAPLTNQYQYDDIAVKFNFNNKECVMGVTYEEYTPYDEEFSNCFTSIVVVPISSEKRLHVGVIEDFLKRRIVNYNDKLDEYDSKYGEEYKGYISDKFTKIKDVVDYSKPTVKYNFSEYDEEWFLELLNEYNLESSIVLFHGYLIIDSLVYLKNVKELNVQRIIDYMEFIKNVIKKFENI